MLYNIMPKVRRIFTSGDSDSFVLGKSPGIILKKSTSNLQLIRVDCGAKFDNQWLGISHS